MITPFRNEPTVDFEHPEHVAEFQEALFQVQETMGQRYPLIIGGHEVLTSETFTSVLPADPNQVFATIARANTEHVLEAVQVARDAFADWRKIAPHTRAHYLLKSAQIIRQRKHEFSATIVYEVGKPWVEADQEVSKVIDLFEYYARQMMRLAIPATTVTVPGEETEMFYTPLGVGAIITPWNFPMAHVAGIAAAAIVTGNTVVPKPASAAPVCATKIVNVFREINVPSGVLNFLPGPGSLIGDRLVDHPAVHFIAFAGSKEVGLHIHQRAAILQPGQIWLKRTILNMGGKNAIIVDETADLQAAAQGIIDSAFGFQGQRSSAGSRAILVDEIYDLVVDQVVKKARHLRIGHTDNPLNRLGPVIDQQAYDKISHYIDIGKREAALLLGGESPFHTGYFIAPTIFGDVPPDAIIAREEIFGPVLACIRARDFVHALEIANDSEYGLTGAVYSRDPQRLEQARHDFHVGNLYFNRTCTGSTIGRHPFGGFNMSGNGAKSGGPDYLLHFLQARAVGERL